MAVDECADVGLQLPDGGMDAAQSIAQYHNRMPVVLDDAQFDDWMRGTAKQAAEMMKPYVGELEAWEVGAEVGNVKNNGPQLILPVLINAVPA